MTKLALFVTIAGFCQFSFAESNQSKRVELSGVDITPALEFFDSQLITLSESKVMYSWSGDGARGDSLKLQRVEKSIDAYWANYGTKNGFGIRMGVGLYTAADPVITRSYGGDDHWLLTELNVPAGFRYLLTTKDRQLPDSVLSIFASFGCPKNVDWLFVNGGAAVSPQCHQLVREIFQERLKIDAIAYYYGSATFADCPKELTSRFAWVILGHEWLKKGSVNYYTAKSRHNLERRFMIQTVFKKAAEFHYHLEKLVNDPKTRDSAIDLVSMSEEQAHKAETEILWNDLATQNQSPAAGEWIKRNIIGCEQEVSK